MVLIFRVRVICVISPGAPASAGFGCVEIGSVQLFQSVTT